MTEGDMQTGGADRQPIVTMMSGEARADSRDVAAYFKKAHGDVLRAIDVILGNRPDLRKRDFALSSYGNDLAESGRTYRCFTMNQLAFSILVMGFTGAEALDFKISYARAFEAMQARSAAPAVDLEDPAALRALLLGRVEKVIELQGQIAQQAPIVSAYARIAEADGSLCIRDAAKALQVRPIDLTNHLITKGWIYRRPGSKEWTAYQPKLSALLLRHKLATIPHEDGHERVRTQVRVTPKGIGRLAEELAVS
ncbi:Rha family transcriptional regulator [Methylobacterium sp. J-092]|uniref:Rha family transcriptional regulator n=1 Tax=Methylobacterium sp. J-092 TaxID=2836667 RepID=UPI001FBBF798|nr:phage regulatory protein/antirepressor Ant [Methylobacterium sp. J-092]MCJ2009790.1 phage regulatory protein/antirepressor Ant [Methylobacterium sp. J-092]